MTFSNVQTIARKYKQAAYPTIRGNNPIHRELIEIGYGLTFERGIPVSYTRPRIFNAANMTEAHRGFEAWLVETYPNLPMERPAQPDRPVERPASPPAAVETPEQREAQARIARATNALALANAARMEAEAAKMEAEAAKIAAEASAAQAEAKAAQEKVRKAEAETNAAKAEADAAEAKTQATIKEADAAKEKARVDEAAVAEAMARAAIRERTTPIERAPIVIRERPIAAIPIDRAPIAAPIDRVPIAAANPNKRGREEMESGRPSKRPSLYQTMLETAGPFCFTLIETAAKLTGVDLQDPEDKPAP